MDSREEMIENLKAALEKSELELEQTRKLVEVMKDRISQLMTRIIRASRALGGEER